MYLLVLFSIYMCIFCYFPMVYTVNVFHRISMFVEVYYVGISQMHKIVLIFGKIMLLQFGQNKLDWLIWLPLLDYVSRAHEIEIRPLSVVRPSVASIISEVFAWISFKF